MLNLHHYQRSRKPLKSFYIYSFLSIYFFFNMLLLTYYPFVHSDEAWLSGLSRAWLREGSVTVTEPFFDLYPRSPHALKIIFHGIQAAVFSVAGYGIFPARLVSLLFGLGALALFYRLTAQLTARGLPGQIPEKNGKGYAGLFTTLLALDPQFIAAAHLGRQEILLLFLLLAGLNLWTAEPPPGGGFKRGLLTGSVVALGIGVHPAVFLVAAALAGALLVSKRRFAALIGLLAASAAGALLFILLSWGMNPDFFRDYAAFGDTVEVGVPWYIKLVRFPDYYQKIWFRHSGTYFIPELRPLFPFYLVAPVLSAALGLWRRDRTLLLPGLALAAFNVALVILGKYGPPLFALQLPLCYLAAALTYARLFSRPGGRTRRPAGAAVGVALVLLVSGSAAYNLTEAPRHKTETYADYTASIRRVLEPEIRLYTSRAQPVRILGNLNAEYALPYGSLLDFRNLDYLKTAGIDFEGYIRSRGITHILYPEEMETIYRERPVWNILYGNVAAYYADLHRFIDKRCLAAGSFASPLYGMRIVPYSGKKAWTVTLYRVQSGVEGP